MIILGVDLGLARTGVAICDREERLASPIGTLEERDETRLAEKLAAIAKERGAAKIVVGCPRNMDGSYGQSARHAQQFAERLSERTRLPCVMWDERLTTVSAHRALNGTDTRGQKRKRVVDTVSAVIILEDYLRSRKNPPAESP